MFELEVSAAFLALIPLTVGLVSVAKSYINPHYGALWALGIGLALSIIVTDVSWGETIISGLVVGLSAMGGYSGAKSMVQ